MRQPSLLLAACLALAGFAADGAAATNAAAPAADAPRFLLLIHGEEAPPADRDAVVEAYRQWARHLAAEGVLVEADELAEEAVLLSAEAGGEVRRSSRAPSAGGYFLLAAADLEAALAIARDCPALRHGGAVEVVAIRRH